MSSWGVRPDHSSAMHTRSQHPENGGPSDRPEGARSATSALDRFLDLTPELACVLGSDWSMERWNATWESVLGWSAPPDVRDLVHADDVASTLDAFQMMARQPDLPVLFENRCLCRDGTDARLAWRGVADGVAGRRYVLARDITAATLLSATVALGGEVDALLADDATDLYAALGLVVARVCEAAGWSVGLVALRDDTTGWRAGTCHDPMALLPDPAEVFDLIDEGRPGSARWFDATASGTPFGTAHVIPFGDDHEIHGAVVFLDERTLLRSSRDRRAAIGETAARLSHRVLGRVGAEQEAHDHRAWLEGRARERTTAWKALADARRRAEQRASQRTAEQLAAARLGQHVLGGDDVNALIDTSINLVAEVLSVEYVGLLQPLPDGDGLILRAGIGWPSVEVGTLVLGRDTSQGGYAISTGSTVVSHDLATERRFPATHLVARGLRSAMSVVIAGPDGPYGVLGVFSKDQRRFSADDAGFLEIIATNLSFALERDRARVDRAEAEEAERRRIGEGIHDDTLQRLAAIALRLDTFALGAPEATAVSRAAAELRRAADGLRTMAFQLHPEGLRRLGLAAALAQLATTIGQDAGFEARIAVDESVSLSEDDQTVLFQVAKEALTNVAKHAGAHHVDIVLDATDGVVSMRLTDDGVGLSSPDAESPVGHLGLSTMRQRVESARGTLRIGAGTTTGTVVEVHLPHAIVDAA